MYSVGELDKDDPRIVCHCEDDFPDTLGLSGFGGRFLYETDFCNALDEMGNILAKRGVNIRGCHFGVLKDVMEKTCG